MMLSQRVARAPHRGAKRPGRIINMVSIYASVASSVYRLSAYVATKAGLANLTRQLAVEWAPLRNPGQRDRARMDSDRGDRGRNRQGRQQASGWRCSLRWDGLGGPEELRGAVIFLAESRLELRDRRGARGRRRLPPPGDAGRADRRSPRVRRERLMSNRSLTRQMFRRKPVAMLMADADSGMRRTQARARRARPDDARNRRDRRRRNLRHDRRRRREIRRPRRHRFVRRLRLRLRDGGAVLRRVRRDDSDRGQRVLVLLRHDGRAGRLDHRMGPGARVRGGRGRRCGRMVGLLAGDSARLRNPSAGRDRARARSRRRRR